MSHSFGQIIRKSGTYAVAVVAARALSFILVPFYTRFLTTADYGVLELLDLTYNFVVVFAGLRLGQALFYFYFAETDDEVRERHMSTNVLASVGLGAIVCVGFWLLAGLLSRFVFGTAQYAHLFRLTAVTVGLAIPMETFLCCLRTFNEPGAYASISVARTVFQGVLNVVLLGWYHMGVSAMLWSGIVSQAILVSALSVHIFKRVPFRFDALSFRKQTGYTIPLSVGAIGEFILNYGDRYFLRTAVSLSEIGVYSLAYKIGMLIPLVQYPFQLYWGSQEVNIVRQEGGWKIFTRVATYFTLGLTASGVFIALFIGPILHIMVPPAFRAAGKYAVWIALAYLVRAVGGYFREIFVIEKRPDLDARVTWAGTIVCLAGYAILIPRHGVWGAVISTVGSFMVVGVYSFWQAQRIRKVEYEYRRLAKVVACAAAVLGVFFVFRPASFWGELALGCVMAVLFGVLLHVSGFWSDDEKRYLSEKLRSFTRGVKYQVT